MKNRPIGLLLALALSACGGGGEDIVVGAPSTASPSPAPTPTPTPAPTPAPTPPAASPTPISTPSNCTFGYSVTANPVLVGVDPRIGEQWHLNNSGQTGGTSGEDVRAFSAWVTTKGQGVRVAVIDDAIETVHPDITPNVVAGASFNFATSSNLPLPCIADDTHGTQVTGLIAARDDNAIGMAGVAPRASIVGFNALATSRNADVADALVRDNQLNVLYNNSWGSPDNGFLQPAESSFNAAIDSGLANGRAGKGSIFVFPAGNGGQTTLANNATIADNSNADGYVNRLGVITTCATDHNGARPSFSEEGSNVLVCAPGMATSSRGLPTTAINGGYSTDFIGTSASTPVVSGVVTLMLAANPNLTWRDVPIILAQTARKNASADSAWSGSGLGRFNHKFGFGVVDANAAVNMARTWTSVGGSSTLKSCTFSATPNLTITDATINGTVSPVSSSVFAAGCGVSQIEFVEVTFSATNHSYSGDLRIRLISPTLTTSELANNRTCGQSLSDANDPCKQTYNAWRFGSVRHMGEVANGTWRLEVTDMENRDIGTFQSWSIKIYGR